MTVRILTGDCRDVLKTLPDASVLSYCAGVIDSDGCIGVRRLTYAMRVVGDSGQPTYSERVAVKQVERQAIDLLRETFGGSFGVDKPSAKRGRPLYRWEVKDRKAAACLEALLPFLRIKHEQAKNCLLLRAVKEQSKVARVANGRGHAGASVRPAHLGDAMQAHYETAKRLNSVGVRP